MAAAELPGAAFLRRRLARAQAVPSVERSPEVQAFITSVELGRQACELLPLLGSGGEARAALPLGDPATTRRLLCALLKLVQIGYMCPPPELWHLDLGPQLRAYAQGLKPAEGGTLGAVALALRLWLMAKTLQQPEPPTADSRLQRIRLAQQAYGLLTAPASRAAIVRQLQHPSSRRGSGHLR